MSYKIAIVEDMPRALHALSQEIVYSGEVEIVFTADNGENFLKKLSALPKHQHPQVVLMDIDMPVMNGIEAVRNGSMLFEDVKYIMLTVSDDDDRIFEALKSGADGYLLKEERADTIIRSISEVIEKQGSPMSPRIARKTLAMLTGRKEKAPADSLSSGLSDRETDILKGMVDGLDYRQLGLKLFISPHTVRNHISKIYEKLHITSRAQAVNLAVRNNWV